MTTSYSGQAPRATVIIPTFGHAPFVRCAIESVQSQTVKELEICVILDGSPASMKELIEELAARDERIRIFAFPKAPRTGEIHRAKIIPQTSGTIICYLAHDDLWLPHHVETMERGLAEADFTHSIHANLGLSEPLGKIQETTLCDLAHPVVRQRMLGPEFPRHGFGLSFGAHTREAYFQLPSGWDTTPDGVPTDIHMWRKFLSRPEIRAKSMMTLSALHFPAPSWRQSLSEEELERILDQCLLKLRDPDFQRSLLEGVFRDILVVSLNYEKRLNDSIEQRTRSLPARKIWKLVWKRITHQYSATEG